MIGGQEAWDFDMSNMSVKCVESDTFGEIPEFSSRGSKFQLIHNLYGVVLWNNSTWVWTHPKCPYLLR